MKQNEAKRQHFKKRWRIKKKERRIKTKKKEEKKSTDETDRRRIGNMKNRETETAHIHRAPVAGGSVCMVLT